MSAPPSIPHTYRTLYRALLLACQYSTPARYVARDTLRQAFRTSPSSAYDAARIAKTLKFLENAAARTGLEHKIVKNLLHVRFWQWKRGRESPGQGQKYSVPWTSEETRQGYENLKNTVEMLNVTMGLCLK